MISKTSELRKLLKFGVVGVSNTVVSYLVFILIIRFVADFPGKAGVAQALSYGAGTLWSFILNSRWTFATRALDGRKFARFLAVQLSLLLASSILILVAVERYGLPPSATWLAVMVVVTIANFLLLRTFVYKEGRDR